ncbi:MAG: acyl-CoA thioesterase [Alicyclobacillus herbarius]|uniref:acyl-CoA thioesterase n=1 Tax=Alicyclobacillus herbarius TaxID=122960 RepID=UPI00042045AC|nr:thioesterase family protein [Alicyclobacillus herbarius]MCL6631556.1 acyl-CoA thioesterase [Alicyclobacillus herbarius]
MFKQEIVVRFGECDGLGHVNNTTYFTYMEHARIDVFRLFNPTLSVAAWNLIAASTRCDFLQQATYAQTLTIYTWIGRIGNRSFDVEHAIQAEDGSWVARGQATLVTFDYTRNASRPLSDEERRALEGHCQAPANVPDLHAR